VGVQEVKWENGGSQPVGDNIFFYGNGNANYHLGTSFFIHQGSRSTGKRVKFVSDRILLRGCWCDNIVLYVHAPTED
jgi:hypothetical protein